LMAMVGGLTAPVQLNEEQLQRIRDAFQDADADPRMRGHELQEMLKHVLTPEQKTKIVASRGMNYVKLTFRRAKLTDEQLQRVEALCGELAEQTDYALNDGKFYRRLADEVHAMLTDAQKQAVKDRGAVAPFGFGPAGGAANPTP